MSDDRFLPRVWTDKGYYYPIFSELGVTYENKNLPFTKENIKDVNWAFRWRFKESFDMEYINTLEQCTGLKDKNGKLIYEGDIVYSPLDNGTKKVIFWDKGLASFMAHNPKDKKFTHGIGDGYFIELEFEVIGNIHENPELLEVQDDN
jgi:hypothetical protein